MSRTKKKKPFRFYSHEGHIARVMTRRKYRKEVKQLIREGKEDLIPKKKGTQGWITW